jgi:type I restriction enzyme S subunit
VITGRYGTVGQVFYIENDFWPLNTTLFVRDFKGNHPRFIAYLLRTLDFLAHSDKSSVPGVNRNHLHTIPVRVPPLAEQREIADVLGALDDKVELNRRIRETLATLARALFRGKYELRARVEQWPSEPLGDHLDVVRGLSYAGAGLASKGTPLHNLDSIVEGGGYKRSGIKHYTGEYRDRHLVCPGDVIVANTEQGFDYLLIAYPALVSGKFGPTGIFSHHLYRVRPRPGSPLTSQFIYLMLLDGPLRTEVAGYANGTTVNMLPADALARPRFPVPPAEVVREIDTAVSPLFERAELAQDESETLAELRDTLLPKLISGEIRLRDAEKAVETAL